MTLGGKFRSTRKPGPLLLWKHFEHEMLHSYPSLSLKLMDQGSPQCPRSRLPSTKRNLLAFASLCFAPRLCRRPLQSLCHAAVHQRCKKISFLKSPNIKTLQVRKLIWNFIASRICAGISNTLLPVLSLREPQLIRWSTTTCIALPSDLII